MPQGQRKAMERGRRRRNKAADSFIPGHTVKNRMTVIARWGAIGRMRIGFFLGADDSAPCFCCMGNGFPIWQKVPYDRTFGPEEACALENPGVQKITGGKDHVDFYRIRSSNCDTVS